MYGFCLLLMLNLVFINYVKLLKNIKVKGIYYGVYEGKKIVDGIEVVLIWEFIDFVKL